MRSRNKYVQMFAYLFHFYSQNIQFLFIHSSTGIYTVKLYICEIENRRKESDLGNLFSRRICGNHKSKGKNWISKLFGIKNWHLVSIFPILKASIKRKKIQNAKFKQSQR